MEEIGTLTLTQVFEAFIAIMALLYTLDKANDLRLKWKSKGKSATIESQIATIESKLKSITDEIADLKKLVAVDKNRLDEYQDGQCVLVQGMLALFSYVVDGVDGADCKNAKENLQNFLINRR